MYNTAAIPMAAFISLLPMGKNIHDPVEQKTARSIMIACLKTVRRKVVRLTLRRQEEPCEGLISYPFSQGKTENHSPMRDLGYLWNRWGAFLCQGIWQKVRAGYLQVNRVDRRQEVIRTRHRHAGLGCCKAAWRLFRTGGSVWKR